MQAQQIIAVVGFKGSGKTTFIQHIFPNLRKSAIFDDCVHMFDPHTSYEPVVVLAFQYYRQISRDIRSRVSDWYIKSGDSQYFQHFNKEPTQHEWKSMFENKFS